MKKATINDVASLAGVSIKTVSRVLNNEPKVRALTQQKVHEAMEELSYRPNSSARRLAGNKTYLLGLIYNANSSYITRIQNGVLEACRNKHYDLLIHPCSYTDDTLLAEITELVTAPRVDGLLLTPPVSDVEAVRRLVAKLNVPCVTLSRESLESSEWTVVTDDREVSSDVVKHLAKLGHRRIAFIRPHPDHRAMANRFEGYKDGMLASGLSIDPALCVNGENTFESGKAAGELLLALEDRPTAIFAANDHMAAGVMRVAHEKGLAIPGDLSVAGFDDSPMASRIWPQLTTVRQPLHDMAYASAEILIKQLNDEPPGDTVRLVPSTLIVRESTGPAPRP